MKTSLASNFKTHSGSLRLGAIILASLALPVSALHAQSQTWNNGTGNSTWDTTSANWVSPTTWTANNTAVFGATGVGAITVSGTQSLGNLTFSNAGYSLNGGTLNFTSATSTINATAAATISSDITGTSVNLLKEGAGELTLTGNITLTNPTTGNNFGATTGAGSLKIAGGTSTFTNVRLLLASADGIISGGNLTFNGAGSGVRGISIGGGRTLTVNGTAAVSTNRLTIANGGSGFLTINNTASLSNTDTVTTIGVASAGNVESIINLNGGTLSSNQFQRNTTGTSTGNSTFNFNGGTLRALSSNSSWFNNIGTTGNFVLTVQSGGAVIDSNGFDVTINQALANGGGGGGLTKDGAGTLTLNGSNTYTGATTVNAGTLAIGASDRIADTSNLNVVGGTFNLNNFNEALGSITGSGNITLGSGTLTTNSSSNTTFSGVVSGASGAIVKNGAGALTLTGNNTYTGNTTVNAGTLLVNNTAGSGTGSGAVSVASGATLGGNGRIGGATTVNGNLQPGSNGPGVLTFSSSLTLSSTANLTMEINGTGARGTDYDGIDVTGALTYGGNLELAIGSPFAAGNYIFSLLGFGSNTGSFASVSLSGAYSGSLTGSSGVWSLASEGNTWTFTQSTGVLAVSVPEPSTWALLGACLGIFLVMHRRHCRPRLELERRREI